ncbi:MAG: anti-ECFsigma factor, ChrR [Phenylobacterium sp.]|jgi:quercetin dioxygenase-like cupin family protein|uniref:cupin domain-containing protein n=1 Tax=Phenylobacterium sp. TaxID=1871053 RepID=UPI00262ABA49|nr:cupin domain-containing protein [Phenylobacterium sp.]MDB5463285.1 anti-ECFsigma factor, ChrR [Phenylobacterium sp.]MDB5499577.1 anti-ECFsigma factor, ChrR [Phenylobacterium sp.]
MLKTTVAVVILVSVASSAGAQVNSADLKWGPAPAVFPKGVQMAVLSGDPAKAGQFVIRLKMPADYKIPAHHHPTDEYVTVVSGDLGLGMGDKLDPAKSAALTAGGFAVAPKGMSHYAFSKAGAVVQVSAEGPFGMTYVNPQDDPTKK